MTAWLDAPDAPGWWWFRDAYGLECVNVMILADGTARVYRAGDGSGRNASSLNGVRWHRTEPPPADAALAALVVVLEGEVRGRVAALTAALEGGR